MDSSSHSHFFATILTANRSKDLRIARALPTPPLKRKRTAGDDDAAASDPENEGDGQLNSHDNAESPPEPGHYPFDVHEERRATININDTEQSRLAGLHPEDAVPGPPFPHYHATSANRHKHPNPSYLISALASLKPPILVAPSRETGPGTIKNNVYSIRARHIQVLTTLLLRCVQDGDWERAGRAWGMLVRTWQRGAVDVRDNGFWGFGAEILLQMSKEVVRPPVAENRRKGKRRSSNMDAMSDDEDMEYGAGDFRSGNRSDDSDAAPSSSASSTSTSSASSPTPTPQTFFTASGFRRARTYFERLNAQYPQTRAGQPGFLSPDFNHALLALLVYEAAELSRRRRWEIESRWPAPSTSTADERRRTRRARRRRRSVRDTEDWDADGGVVDENSGSDESPVSRSYSQDEEDEDNETARHEEQERANAAQYRRAQALATAAAADLDRARALVERLDELLLTPPYDQSPTLLELRGHVAVWIGDLVRAAVPPPSAGADAFFMGGDDAWDDEMEGMGEMTEVEFEAARQVAERERREEWMGAREFFERARDAGAVLSKGALEVLQRLEDGEWGEEGDAVGNGERAWNGSGENGGAADTGGEVDYLANDGTDDRTDNIGVESPTSERDGTEGRGGGRDGTENNSNDVDDMRMEE
ncbi:MAG: hypothetical protein M1821_008053 [Bathelium mastoideum]|nr:MAG: hypothetical protein M1821_008053 [Bathelium mastoideum]